MCAYPQSDHALSHWKCVLRCCSKCPFVNISVQETDDQYSNTRPSNRFHIYHIIAQCTAHGRLPLNDKKICNMSKQYYDSEQPTRIYTRKEIVMMEKTISNFHTNFYIQKVQKLEFHLPHVQILGTNHCEDSCWTAFKLHESFQDALCCRDYAERLVASFPYKI